MSAAAALRRPGSGAVAVFGLFAGLAFWTNQLTWPALAVFALAVFARSRHRLALGLAFAAGSAPFWGYNLAHPLATFRYLAVHFAEGGQIAAHTRILLAHGLPRFFGGPTLADVTGAAPLRWLGIALALAVLVPLAAARVLPIATALRARCVPEFEDLLLLAVAASIPFRRNAEFNQLLHLAPLVAVLVAVAPARLSRRWLYVFPVALAGLGAAELVGWLPGFYRDASAPRELVAFLERHGVRAAYAEHRPAYLIAWHSEERIATSPALSYGYFVDRYPPYTERVRAAPVPAFVFEAESVNERRFRDELAALGVTREASLVAGYHVYLGEGLPRPPVYAVPGVPSISEGE